MNADRQLSRDFWLHEFTGWRRASSGQVARLQEFVDRVLQPVRDRFGPTVPTSWVEWSDGRPRTGSHREGGTADFVVPGADLRAVFEWGRSQLLPSGYLGRWIYEPERRDSEGRKTQGEHIHGAARADMLAAFGVGDVGAFEETAEGVYAYAGGGDWGGHTGAYGDPIPIPGFDVAVPSNPVRWVLAGIAMVALVTAAGERLTYEPPGAQ